MSLILSKMNIGPYSFDTPLILAPMAGVTDHPFRKLCTQLGADLCIGEMVSAQQHLWHSRKTRLRLNHTDEQTPCSVQIVGTDPLQMAAAARFNANHGAHIIDINMGCPAKKVCHVQAGSALMKNELLVARILEAVVNAVTVPVTLKIRTGWDKTSKNAVNIAHIAENSGVQSLTIHGRTRGCGFSGEAEYDTIATVKTRTRLPVIANGDINNAEKARQVLDYTDADGLMIGRAAQGNPWIFQQIRHFLQYSTPLTPPSNDKIILVLLEHLKNLYNFYGEIAGVRIARKHIAWYCKNQMNAEVFRQQINTIEDAETQQQLISDFFAQKPFTQPSLYEIRHKTNQKGSYPVSSQH